MSRTQGKTKTARDEAFKLTEAVGRALRAFTDATAEVSIGGLKLASEMAVDFAENVAKTVGTAVSEPANIAQRGVDRFFSTLSPEKADEENIIEVEKKITGEKPKPL